MALGTRRLAVRPVLEGFDSRVSPTEVLAWGVDSNLGSASAAVLSLAFAHLEQ